MTPDFRKIFKNNTFQTAVLLTMVVLVIAGFYLAERQGYVVVVPTGSMCIPENGACDGWTHPFERTLHVGDILIVFPVAAKDLNENYPDSDIIVFHNPFDSGELIVHRIISKTQVDGVLYFSTKGDGNGNKWPETPRSAFDSWDYSTPPGVSQDLVVGRVALRIPWIGHLTLFIQNEGSGTVSNAVIPLIVVLIVLIVIAEFVWPLLKKRGKTEQQTEKSAESQ